MTPDPGSSRSNPKTFNFVNTLLYPRLVSNAGTNAASNSLTEDDSEYTGIAVANLGLANALAIFRAFDQLGTPLIGAGITNPGQLLIQPLQQRAAVDWEIFGAQLPNYNPTGWFRVESTAAGILGFFLMFNGTVSILDGSDVAFMTAARQVLPEIEQGGFTQVHIVNPDIQPAEVLIELYGADGTLRAVASRTVPSTAVAVERMSDLFPGVVLSRTDYVWVVSNGNVLLFEYMGRANRYVRALNAQNADTGASVLYSPQYAVGGGMWSTAISIVNLDDREGTVTLRLIGDDGIQLGATQVLPIAARGKLHIENPQFFVNAENEIRQGYVVVQSDGIRLVGSVTFGDLQGERISSSLPLISTLQREFVFSQQASDDEYYTGVALLNPGNQVAQVTIEVYDEEGQLIVARNISIGPGSREIGVLAHDYFPTLQGQNQRGGYIRIRSDRPLAGFALFGTQRDTALSAVYPQAVP
jgi:hypothetical protein